jgi:phospholipase D1/2
MPWTDLPPQRRWLSRYTMDVLRERLLKQLAEADHHGRLRLYYPFLPDLGHQCLNVHSKVLIIDNELIRIGSAN